MRLLATARQSVLGLLAKKNPCGKAWGSSTDANQYNVLSSYQDCTSVATGKIALFIQFPHDLWPHLRTAFEVSVMLRILQRCAFDGNGVCFETRDTMAQVCGLSPKQWTKVIKDLEERGLIVVSRAHRAPNQITLGQTVKTILEGKNDPLKKYNNIYCGSNLPTKEKRPRKRRVNYDDVTEVERIHAKWLKTKDKGT